ncbi:MAG: class I SAM-dependent methyltransferase [Candidatus Babeliales bacterium]
MDYQNILFKNYNATRTTFLDPNDEIKFEWFKNYYQKIYKNYFVNINKKSKILELGCNKGFLLKTFEEQGYSNLYGVDLSKDDLDSAKLIIPTAKLYQQDVFEFLKNNKNSFDIIILKALIEHIKKEKILEFLELINNSLTPGGMVLIDVQNSAWLWGLHDRYVDFTHEVGFTQESLRQVMLLHFNKVQVTPTKSPLGPMGRKDRIKHFIAKKIFFFLCKWADPESPSIQERLLIATGKKQNL